MPHLDPSRRGEKTENQRQYHGQTLSDDQKPPPVQTVRQNSSGHGKDDDRKTTKKSRQTQLEGRTGDLIDLPSDSHSRDLTANRGEQKAAPKKSEISLA